ncbi:alpha-2-macroglobulin-like protein 1 [Mantella aurantiaca]
MPMLTQKSHLTNHKTQGRKKVHAEKLLDDTGEGPDMMIWALCLLLSLAGTLAQDDKKPTFGVFCPPDLYYPSEETICIHTSGDLKDFSRLLVNLETSAGTKTLYKMLPNMPAWNCQSFQVPEPSKDTENVQIKVQGIAAGGDKVEFSSKSLTVRKKSVGTFVQSDKSVYKQGQEMKFRVVTINQDMEVQNNNYSLIEFQDPQGNRLAQWKDVSPKSGIVELSYQLAEETNLGKYKIKVNGVTKELQVNEYVLPKFDVAFDAPNSISVEDDILTISIFGRYTYGEKVQGNVSLKVCQKKQPRWQWWGWSSEEDTEPKEKDLCHTEVAKTDRTGNTQHVLDLGKFNLQSSDYKRELTVESTVEEDGTGVKFSATKSIQLESQLTKLSFKDTKSYFLPGVPYRGKVSLTSFDGRPLTSAKVIIKASYNGEVNREPFITDSNGEVAFELPTEKWGKNSVSLEATTNESNAPYTRGKVSISYGRAYLYLKDVYVETKSYLYIRPVRSSAPCDQNVEVTVDYSLAEEEDKGCFDLFYLVMLNGKISQQGQKKVERSKSDSPSGSVEFSLPIRDISSSGKILVFMVSESGAVVADTTTVQVTPCLKHAVNLKFSEDNVLPKANLKMNLKANGGSFCALRSVDKSVVLMKPEDELTDSKFQNLVIPKRTYIRSDSLDYSMCNKPQPPFENTDEILDLVTLPYSGWWRSYPEKKKDLGNIIQDMGLLVLTSWKIFAPVTCKTQRIEPVMAKEISGLVGSFARAPGIGAAPGAPAVMEIVNYDFEEENDEVTADSADEARIFFPETWLWEIQQIPSSGLSEVSVTVPDTITTWSAQMFCVGAGGLGLSPPTAVTVFKPYFVEPHLPYSVKRGENMQLKASVFNYMGQELMIRTLLEESDQYLVSGPRETTFCLGGGQKKTMSWQITPSVLGLVNISITSRAVKGQCGGQDVEIPDKGRKDSIIQTLLVEAEGTLVEKAHNSMLMMEDGNPVSEEVKLELPESSVVGSERGFISFTSDIMGSALSNIDSLLAMSCGCGEQNMLQFAPNVYILRYLKSSGQLTDAIMEKGKKFLDAGQQRQLTYKHPDGSYSAFGTSDPEGSTWLTGFVIKSFCQARDFCFIDEKHIKQGLSFLEEQQKDDGCFKATGRVLHNGMKGGVDDEISLTAYIVVALLECGRELHDPVVKKALQCLKAEPAEKATPYKMALKAYAYTLANCSEERADVMQLLHDKSNKGDGMMYWSQEAKVEKDSYWSKPKSVEVEITSYVCLTMLSLKKITNKDMGDIVAIIRWMNKQQNGNGGFSSTQDTVVGLQCLAQFATITSGKMGEIVLDVTSKKGFQHSLLINNDNRLLLQKVALPEVPGEYLVMASGVGTLFMQVVQRYNSPPEVKVPAFAISVQTQCMENGQLTVLLEFWYKGSRPSTNMALLEFKFLSGYVPEMNSIEELKKDPDVKRVEIKEDMMNIYLEEVISLLFYWYFSTSMKVIQNLPILFDLNDHFYSNGENKSRLLPLNGTINECPRLCHVSQVPSGGKDLFSHTLSPLIDLMLSPLIDLTLSPLIDLTLSPLIDLTLSPLIDLTLSPLIDLTLSPLIDLTLSPLIDLTLSPLIDLTLSPLIDLTLSPLIDLTLSPLIDLTLSPLIDLTLSPLIDLMLSPLIDLTLSPLIDLTLNPLIDLMLSPLIDLTLSPLIDLTLNPLIDLTLSPLIDLTLSPLIDLTLSPLIDLTLSPLIDLTLSPLIDLTLSPRGRAF